MWIIKGSAGAPEAPVRSPGLSAAARGWLDVRSPTCCLTAYRISVDNGTPNWTECPLLPRLCSVCSLTIPFPITYRTHEVNDHNTSAPLCSAVRLLYSLSFNPLVAVRSIPAGSEPPASRTGLVVAHWLFIPPRSAARLVFEAESSRWRL